MLDIKLKVCIDLICCYWLAVLERMILVLLSYKSQFLGQIFIDSIQSMLQTSQVSISMAKAHQKSKLQITMALKKWLIKITKVLKFLQALSFEIAIFHTMKNSNKSSLLKKEGGGSIVIAKIIYRDWIEFQKAIPALT